MALLAENAATLRAKTSQPPIRRLRTRFLREINFPSAVPAGVFGPRHDGLKPWPTEVNQENYR
jgi:hypothetical protein